MALYMACKHRTAAHKDCRHIDSRCCHQKSRHVFVTVRHHHQRVKLMRHCHCLCGIRNQVSGNQGILHSDMSHGNSVADCDCRKYNRSSPRHGHALFYRVHDFIQIHVARYNLIIGTDNSHQWAVHLFLCHAKGMKQRTVRSLLCSLCHCITSHNLTPVLLILLFVFYYQTASAIKSPISLVPTSLQPSDMMSTVRYPSVRTF